MAFYSYFRSRGPIDSVSTAEFPPRTKYADFVGPWLTENAVGKFRAGNVYDPNSRNINQIDFSNSGKYMVTSSDDDKILVYNVNDREIVNTIFTRKYGADLVQFCTNSESTALYASTKINYDVRHVSLTENKYIQYFEGHSDKVVSLCVSCFPNAFATGSLDRTVKLWDLRSPHCREHIDVIGRPVVGLHPNGSILGIGVNSQELVLYDVRFIQKKPINITTYFLRELYDWTDIKFSPDGHAILIPTNGPVFRLVSAINGKLIHTFFGHENTRREPIPADFSPDSQYVFSGSTNGQIHVWDSITGYEVGAFKDDRSDSINCVKVHHKYQLIASSASTITTLWVPPSVTYTTNLQ